MSTDKLPPAAGASQFLRIKELAARWNVSTRHIRRLISEGRLRVHRIGRSVRIAFGDVIQFEALNR